MPGTSDRSGDSNNVPGLDTDLMVDLTVVIVNYNVCTFLEQALVSVYLAGANRTMEVFVVDNGSVDGSVEMIRDRFPDVTLIVNEHNVGFGAANNIAIRQARGKFVFVLNPDTIVQEDTLDTFIAFMERHPDAGMAGCQILNPDGTFARESRRSFPTPSVAFFKVVGLSRLFPKSRLFGQYNLTYLPEDQEATVDALSGSCMFVRRAAIRYSYDDYAALTRAGNTGETVEARSGPGPGSGAGLFDESFFMYGEDLDWCYRFGVAGWKIYYTPETQIIHFKGESTKQGELRYVRLFYGAMSQFVQKHFESRHSRIFSKFLHFGIWVKAAQSVARQWLKRILAPLSEWILALLCIQAIALVRSIPSTFSFPSIFYSAVSPLYASAAVLGIAAARGYRHRNINRPRPVWQGVFVAFLVVTTASFFVKSIAFSRVVILFGFLTTGIALLVFRWIRRELSERRVGQRQAVVVGSAKAAEQFQRLLKSHPMPPLEVVGYVELTDHPEPSHSTFSTLPRLGRADQLRDIVRLRHIDDIVFAAGHVTNQAMFSMMRKLLDLPIQFKILQPGQTQIAGKSFVGELSLTPPLIDAEAQLAFPRSRFERKLTEVTISGVACIALIVIFIPAFVMSPSAGWLKRLRNVAFGLSGIVSGRHALIGYDRSRLFKPPVEWGVEEGIVPVTPTARSRGLSRDQLQQVYWKYTQSQSFGLDMRIVVSHIKTEDRSGLI